MKISNVDGYHRGEAPIIGIGKQKQFVRKTVVSLIQIRRWGVMRIPFFAFHFSWSELQVFVQHDPLFNYEHLPWFLEFKRLDPRGSFEQALNCSKLREKLHQVDNQHFRMNDIKWTGFPQDLNRLRSICLRLTSRKYSMAVQTWTGDSIERKTVLSLLWVYFTPSVSPVILKWVSGWQNIKKNRSRRRACNLESFCKCKPLQFHMNAPAAQLCIKFR
jgi:hypothetical protein